MAGEVAALAEFGHQPARQLQGEDAHRGLGERCVADFAVGEGLVFEASVFRDPVSVFW